MNSQNFKMDADFVREALGLGSTRGKFGMFDSVEIVRAPKPEAHGLDMVPEYSGHLIDDLNARVDNVIALAQLERVRKLCSSLFPEDIPCTHIAVTFCADCGREICLNCAEKFLMETYCEQCGEQERRHL